jgi:hypothetical protein
MATLLSEKSSSSFFLWHYSPWWTLASSKIVVQFQILEASQQNIFNGMGLLAPHPTPNLEDQGIPFCLGHHL